jgi:hypothetical protein
MAQDRLPTDDWDLGFELCYPDNLYDGQSDREQSVVETEQQQEPTPQKKPSRTTMRRTGVATTNRIGAGGLDEQATPQGPGNPMRDRNVIAELRRPAPDERNVDFPYQATVTTRRDPLRLRASASLSAPIIGRLPRGATVTVTGLSQSHFRPVTYVDPERPDRPMTGWAFTAYLSPPKLKPLESTPTSKEEQPPAINIGNFNVDVVAEEEPIVLLPTPGVIGELTLQKPDPVAAATVTEAPLANTDQAITGRVVDQMGRLNGSANLTSGVHFKDEYRQQLEVAGQGASYDRRWDKGHTASSSWIQPYELDEPFAFVLKEGKSASEGLRQWLAGLTIADCTVAMIAIELDAVRAVVGDRVFDRCFGSPGEPPRVMRLKLSQRISETPLYGLVRFTDAARNANRERGQLGRRPVRPGEWYYFYNHPDYELKHPGGAWRGENALYIGEREGKQMWTGFGVEAHDEEWILRELLRRYNAPRDQADFSWLERNYSVPANWDLRFKDGFAANDPMVTPVPNDGARDQVNVDQIVTAQNTPTPSGTPKEARQRPIGVDLSTGMVLSTAKLADLARTYGDDDVPELPDDVA